MSKILRDETSVSYGSIDPAGSNRTELAQTAYGKKDKDLSRMVHDQKAAEGHRVNGDLIKSVIYGGVDGILATFAIIGGAAGGSLGLESIFVLGISNVLANAVSMGMGDAISTLAYREHVMHERARECWEFENFPEGEIEEMVDLYQSKGLPREKAQVVVETMSKYRDFFIDVMMTQELRLIVPDEDEGVFFESFATFAAFVFFGSVPLLAYTIIPWMFGLEGEQNADFLFTLSCFLTMSVLFMLGAGKSRFSAKSWFESGLEFMLLGSATAAVSYGVANFVAYLGDGSLDAAL